MERIGIRELRQHASRWVRRAAGGETFEITDRGRPVALLVPPRRDGDGIERLRAEGRTRRATRDLLDLGPPLPAEPGGADLGVVVTYDVRTANAARALGLDVAAP